jgi:hypothetical protein
MKVEPGLTLDEFLNPKLGGSSLTVRKISEDEFYVESDELVQIHFQVNKNDKKIIQEIYSPKWQRQITVQQIEGNEFLELQAEEMLQQQNFGEVAEDVLLTLDLARTWARSRKFIVIEKGADISNPEEAEPLSGKRNTKTSRK